jgi:alkaline phosphatase D
MVPETKGKSLDTWDGFPEEREEIFRFIESEAIGGVVILAADRHRHDAWQIKRPNGYDLYEFMSSRLTNIHSHPILDHQTQCLFGVGGLGYGRVTFDTTLPDPTITYEIVDAEKKVPMSAKKGTNQRCAITLKLSQLK